MPYRYQLFRWYSTGYRHQCASIQIPFRRVVIRIPNDEHPTIQLLLISFQIESKTPGTLIIRR